MLADSACTRRRHGMAVMGREDEFRAFAEMLSMRDIGDAAADIMRDNSIPVAMSSETIVRLRKVKLSESRKKLAFIYSTAFAKLRAA